MMTVQKICGHRVQSRFQYSPLNSQSSLPVYGLVPRVNQLNNIIDNQHRLFTGSAIQYDKIKISKCTEKGDS